MIHCRYIIQLENTFKMIEKLKKEKKTIQKTTPKIQPSKYLTDTQVTHFLNKNPKQKNNSTNPSGLLLNLNLRSQIHVGLL